MNPKELFNDLLFKALNKQYGVHDKRDVATTISYCDPKFGEFSTNIAFRLSKSESCAPAEAAERIIKELNKSKTIKKAEFLPPGFINVIMDNQVWIISNQLMTIFLEVI
jgi:arginyl-tRNA synthetase